MKINLYKYLQGELELMDRLITQNDQNVGWNRIDLFAYERIFIDTKIIMVVYHELLEYDYVYREGVNTDKKTVENYHTPWIVCRFEFEGANKDEHLKYLKKIKEWFDKFMPYLKYFRDEDALFGCFGIATSPYSRDWTQYKIYFNPDFPNGWWENHTL